MKVKELNKSLGNIDLYLLDQILKEHIQPTDKILDAGCGEGRNLIYFLNNGYQVSGIDQNPDAIRMLQFIVGAQFPNYNKAHFQTGALEKLPYDDQSFDYVICSAVLHFAKSENNFWEMFEQLDKVLIPDGSLFIRMTSDIGLDGHLLLQDGNYKLPDGSQRFLLKTAMIDHIKNELGYTEIEPVKTMLVDKQRSMTTLVFKKNKSK